MRTIQSVIINFACFSVCICGISCGTWLLPPLEVVSIHIENDVKILFSATPSKQSIKNAFSITEDGVTLSGNFLFDDKYVVFTPVNGIRQNHAYIVTVTTMAEDEKGNSLLNDFIYQFHTKDVTEAPAVLSIYPENESVILTEPSALVFTFSKPVSERSFINAFKIAPSVNHLLEWNSDFTSVSVLPASPMGYGRYTVSVSTNLTDEYENRLLNAFTSTFLYGTDKTEPEYTMVWESGNSASGAIIPEAITDKIPLDAEIHITFNETVAIESIAGFFTITPSTGFTVTPDLQTKKDAVITFSKPPVWNETYALTVHKGIGDIYGNKTSSDARYTLLFDNSKYKPGLFKGAFFKTGAAYKQINSLTNYTELALAAVDFPQGTLVAASLYVVFNISPGAGGIFLPSAMRNISISTTNGCASISIKTMTALTRDELIASDIYGHLNLEPDDNPSALKLGVEVYNQNKNGLITFYFGRDISDSLGNKMTDDCSFTYSKQ
jgi:hypothetical protein